MDENVAAKLIPLVLALIMLGMGLSLTPADFRRVARSPRAAILGVVNQLVLLPALAFALVFALSLEPTVAVGLVLVAASPGGPGSNLLTHLAKGDTALSVSLTAISGVATVVTTPLYANYAIASQLGRDTSIALPLLPTIAQLFAVAVLPVGLGMLARHRWPGAARRLERPVKVVAGVALGLLVVGAVLREVDDLAEMMVRAGLAVVALNWLALLLGYLTSRAASLPSAQQTCIALETGIQNLSIAFTIAVSPSLLGAPELAVPAVCYTVFMLPTALVLVGALNLRSTPDAAELPEATTTGGVAS